MQIRKQSIMITAKSNSQMKYISQLLKKKSAREEDRVFVCEGKKMFFEVLRQAPELLVKAYWSVRGLASLEAEEAELLNACPYEEVADDVLDSVAETVTPQGVLAIVRMPVRTIDEMIDSGKGLLLLETLQDPGNLGTILRTAEAAGIGGVILSSDSVDAYGPKVVRATMGAIFRVPFLYAEHFTEVLSILKLRGIRLYAAHLKGSVPYDEPDYAGRYAIMIGNEGNGLTDEATELADVRVRIPMEGKAESLNAAVAAAILMYQARK